MRDDEIIYAQAAAASRLVVYTTAIRIPYTGRGIYFILILHPRSKVLRRRFYGYSFLFFFFVAFKSSSRGQDRRLVRFRLHGKYSKRSTYAWASRREKKEK